MYDSKMNRMTAQVSFGRDYSDRPAPEMSPCPSGTSTDTGPTLAFPAPRRRWWRR
jgi:hypothetical protein